MSEVFTLHNLPSVQLVESYAVYCRSRREVGLEVIPETLFDKIREDTNNYDLI